MKIFWKTFLGQWGFINIYTAGKILNQTRIPKIILRAIDRLSAFAAQSSKFLSCSGVRMRMVTLSHLEKWRIVLKKLFWSLGGRRHSSLLHLIWLVVVTLKVVYRMVVLTEISCLFLGQDEAGSWKWSSGFRDVRGDDHRPMLRQVEKDSV